MPLVLAEVVGRYWRADWIAPLMGRGLVETVEFIPDWAVSISIRGWRGSTYCNCAVGVEVNWWRGHRAYFIKLRSRSRDGGCVTTHAPTTTPITAAVPRLSLHKSCRLQHCASQLELTRRRATTILVYLCQLLCQLARALGATPPVTPHTSSHAPLGRAHVVYLWRAHVGRSKGLFTCSCTRALPRTCSRNQDARATYIYI